MEPRAGWKDTIDRARSEIESLLEDSPSLCPAVAKLIARELPKARRFAGMALTRHGETPRADLETLAYSDDQVLGEWFPDTS
jgi:hypothetical protein